MQRYVMTVRCPDRPGIVHAFAGELLRLQANILENAQFSDPLSGLFCMRTYFESPIEDAAKVRTDLQTSGVAMHAEVVVQPDAIWERVLILVSKFDHCLLDLLYRRDAGELEIDIPVIVSNHPDCAPLAERYGVPFVHLPVTKDTKAAQEQRLLELVEEHRIDFVVLARYMQILSPELCARLAGRAINIHHSFLPGFKGAKPYHQAHERGVKLIGATAHYVTSDLDEGPIIEQDVVRVNHSLTADDFVVLGRDVERNVLSRAVKYQAENRVMLLGTRVVVFP